MTDTTDLGYCSDCERAREVVKLPQAALDAWMDYEPPEVRHISSALRHAFMSGYLAAAPQPMGEDAVERVARAICEEIGFDPDYLEPGDDPYQERAGMPSPCIDGYNSKGEPCHFFWRHYHLRARAALAAMPQPTSTVEAGDALLREARFALETARDYVLDMANGAALALYQNHEDVKQQAKDDLPRIDAALAKLDTAEKGDGGAMKRGFDSALPALQPRNQP